MKPFNRFRRAACLTAWLAASPLCALPALAQQPATGIPGGPALQPVRPSPTAPSANSETLPIPAATPEHFAAARELVVMTGLSRTIEVAIPNMSQQINATITRTRPELAAPVKATLDALQPEFMKLLVDMIDNSARIYTALLNEKETRETLTFFKSDSGRKFIEMQPSVYANVSTLMGEWNKFLSSRMYEMTRDALKKQGVQL